MRWENVEEIKHDMEVKTDYEKGLKEIMANIERFKKIEE